MNRRLVNNIHHVKQMILISQQRVLSDLGAFPSRYPEAVWLEDKSHALRRVVIELLNPPVTTIRRTFRICPVAWRLAAHLQETETAIRGVARSGRAASIFANLDNIFGRGEQSSGYPPSEQSAHIARRAVKRTA